MKTLTIELNENSIYEVNDFVEAELDEYDCSPKTINQIEIAIEEIVTNVVSYSGLGEHGSLNIGFDVEESTLQLKLVFADAGKPFDPLAKPDPDLSVEARSTEVGGLGIYMVKQLMDDVSYEHVNGMNTLTVYKSLS